MATIEVDEAVKRSVSFAARMADVTEGEIVRRLIARSSHEATERDPRQTGVPVYADYEGHRTRALYFAPARVEIIDGPLEGKSFKTPTGAARAVVRHYNPSVNDNRNGWEFWQIDNGGGPRAWLQSIRPLRPSALSVRRPHRACFRACLADKFKTQNWNHPCAPLPRAYADESGYLRGSLAC